MSFELATGAAAATLDGTERLAVLQGGAARAATVTQVKNYLGNTSLNGDISGSGSGTITTTIAPHAITFAKYVAAPSAGIVGASAAGDYQHVTIGTGLSLTAGVLAATGGGAGGLTDGDKGDVVVSGSGSVWTIDANAVSFAKHVAAPSAGIVGANAAGNYQHVTIGTGLSLSAGVLTCTVTGGGGGVTDGDKGDVVISGTGTVYTIDANAVSFSKFAAAPSAGLVAATATGNYQHVTLGSGLAFSGSTLTATGSNVVATRTALAALTGMAAGDIRDLSEAGREGRFKYSTANLSTQVTNDPGQGVYVPPASATTGASGAWVRLWNDALNVKWFGAVGDGTTSDTTAIQRALNLAVTFNVSKIYLPEGVYIVTNLTLPAYSVVSGNQLKVVEIDGYAHPSILFGTAGSGYTMSTSGSIIKSSATTGGAILTVTPSAGTFSFYHLVCRNLLFRTYDNPLISAIDASQAENVTLENVGVDTGTYSVSIAAQPTNTTSGIKLAKINNACFNYLRNVSVVGYYCGIEFEEHSNADNIFLTACAYAMFLNASYHTMDFGRICIQNCVHGPTVVGAVRFSIRQLNLEHATSGWQQTTEDFRDVSLSGKGKIYWASTIAGSGAAGGFTKNGGTGVYCVPISGGTDERKSLFYGSGTTTVPDSTDTYLAFTGTYCASGLQVNGTDNTHIDCIEAGTFSFAARAMFPANGTGMRAISIIKNGTNVIDGDSKTSAGASDPTRVKAVRMFVDMAVGDYVRVAVKQTSGGSLALPRNTDDSGHLEAVMTGPLV